MFLKYLIEENRDHKKNISNVHFQMIFSVALPQRKPGQHADDHQEDAATSGTRRPFVNPVAVQQGHLVHEQPGGPSHLHRRTGHQLNPAAGGRGGSWRLLLNIRHLYAVLPIYLGIIQVQTHVEIIHQSYKWSVAKPEPPREGKTFGT